MASLGFSVFLHTRPLTQTYLDTMKPWHLIWPYGGTFNLFQLVSTYFHVFRCFPIAYRPFFLTFGHMKAPLFHVNANPAYNDGVYGYEEVRLLFPARLGRAIYRYDLQTPRKPDLSRFKVQSVP